ncbi:MAG: glycerol acyltransferase [Ignavibacteriaceae bacterium]|nr:glycerol acyltransferase [Ignavibacteriaceae bacterium]
MLKIISKLALRILGWRLDGKLPELDKYVLIGAPHTSNWDSVYGFLGAGAIGLRFKWIAKQSVFPGPLSPILKFFGGIPIDRSVRSSIISRMVELFNKRDKFVLGLMPEGTRSKTEFWKTGFYYIAKDAKLPIAFAFLDYGKKRVGIADLILHPTGDIERDMVVISNFYKGMKGKHPEKQGKIEVKPVE